MQPIKTVLGTLFVMTALGANAHADPAAADFKSSVMAKAAESEKGVIVVLSKRGGIAADAAYLLVLQLKQNPGFVPLLMAEEPEKLEGYMKILSLPNGSLPAVIFFNKSGKELGRVIGAQPTAFMKRLDMPARLSATY